MKLNRAYYISDPETAPYNLVKITFQTLTDWLCERIQDRTKPLDAEFQFYQCLWLDYLKALRDRT
jgi:hypothetical protein